MPMPLVDLYGHEELRERVKRSAQSHSLPASLLLHGPLGVGKQRLALWIGQLLLCERGNRPCGECKSCRYARDLTHPDLHWYFPRPRLKDSDPEIDDVKDDYRDAIQGRLENGGLYEAPSGSEGIYIATVRAIVQEAAMTPAMGKEKVFVIGDAERMVPQEGAEYAANAFLKLLEEPPQDTHIILTSSEPGALLPTIRSRTASVRVPFVSESAVREFVADDAVSDALNKAGVAKSINERTQLAQGAPGNLFGGDSRSKAMTAARKLLEAAAATNPSTRYAAAMASSASGARGAFTDVLDSLLIILGERMRAALHDGNERRAALVARASEKVGEAKIRASGNVNPQLITADLLKDLSAAVK